jgi:hypothetical protein
MPTAPSTVISAMRSTIKLRSLPVTANGAAARFFGTNFIVEVWPDCAALWLASANRFGRCQYGELLDAIESVYGVLHARQGQAALLAVLAAVESATDRDAVMVLELAPDGRVTTVEPIAREDWRTFRRRKSD